MDAIATPRAVTSAVDLPSTTPTTDFALIECEKENIRPLASGRSAATLSSLFEKQSENVRKILEVHDQHRADIEEAERRDKDGEEMQEGVADVLDAYNK